jgi:hypothetical protein
METATRDDRWNPKPPKAFDFTANDLALCKLFVPFAREPWGYQYLPTHYIGPLVGRSYTVIRDRAKDLVALGYLALPDQPRTYDRFRIFSNGPNGLAEVREAGIEFPKFKLRQLKHELMACLIAASFEYGANKNGLEIVTRGRPDCDVYADWPLFTINGTTVWLEADTGTETQAISANPDVTTIAGKFEEYLKLIHDRQFKNSMAIFVTHKITRMESMIEVLKKVIDHLGLPHRYADHFGFSHMQYDRFLHKIPPLTDWAVTQDYKRAGGEAFNFVK